MVPASLPGSVRTISVGVSFCCWTWHFINVYRIIIWPLIFDNGVGSTSRDKHAIVLQRLRLSC